MTVSVKSGSRLLHADNSGQCRNPRLPRAALESKRPRAIGCTRGAGNGARARPCPRSLYPSAGRVLNPGSRARLGQSPCLFSSQGPPWAGRGATFATLAWHCWGCWWWSSWSWSSPWRWRWWRGLVFVAVVAVTVAAVERLHHARAS